MKSNFAAAQGRQAIACWDALTQSIEDGEIRGAEHIERMRSIPGLREIARDSWLQERLQFVYVERDCVDVGAHVFFLCAGRVSLRAHSPSGTRIVGYLRPGDVFPLVDETRRAIAYSGEHAECLRMSLADFTVAVQRYPSLASLEKRIDERSFPLAADFVEARLHQARAALVVDPAACTRCGDCLRVCGETHGGQVHLALDFRGPRVGRFIVLPSCRACDDAPCLPVCPVAAIERSGRTDAILINDRCTGCQECIKSCPHSALTQEPATCDTHRPRASGCDLCESVGRTPGVARCVYVCPHGALERIGEEKMLEEHEAAFRPYRI